MKISAYMIAHCDDDFLESAIASVIDHVDELVFVDGAYKWIAPFFQASGLDPERSWPRTHDILARFAPKIRYFSGLWDDELHKRSFAYEQCAHDVIIRIDADEILQFDDAAFDGFLESRKGVAQMEIPFMLAPDKERLKMDLTATPRLCAVFKASHFRSPVQHCSYLWLILTAAERQRCGPVVQDYIHEPAVIRTAHLTGLRTPRTSVNRARFYTLQHVRITGHLGWHYNQKPAPSPDAKIMQIMDFMSADDYGSYLEGHDIVSGFAAMHGFSVTPYGFGDPVRQVVQEAYDDYNQSLADLLDFAARPRTVVSGMQTMINVTSMVRRGVRRFELTFADDMVSADSHLYFLMDSAGDQAGDNTQPVHAQVTGRTVHYIHDPVDDTRILQAVLIVRPVTHAASHKTKIVDLKPLAVEG